MSGRRELQLRFVPAIQNMPSFFQNLSKQDSDELPTEVPETRPGTPEQNSLLSVMNLSSPFAVSAEEQFTVREISMLLPPQFVRSDSAPGEQPVMLPLDVLRNSLQQGRPALRLSQIYQACPFLFSRPVAPAEDVEIVLPFQKVKRIVEPGSAVPGKASPFAAVAPREAPPATAPRKDSPFAVSPFSQPGEAQAASPFPVRTSGAPAMPAASAGESPFVIRAAAPAPQSEVLSPFASASAPGREPAPTGPPENPFQRMEAPSAPPRPASSPFSLVTPATAPPAETPEPKAPSLGFTPHPPPATAPAAGMPSPFAPSTTNGDGHPAKTESLPPMAPPLIAAAPAQSAEPPEKKPAAQPVPLPPAPSVEAPRPAAEAPSGDPRTLRVPLASLLRDVTAQDLGFDPGAVPNTVDVELSYDTILPQLATGRVEVGIEDLRQGVVERFRPAFGRVRPDLRFVVPLSEVFQNLPASVIPALQPAEHVSINTTPFQTPFAIKADEDQSRMELPVLPRATTAAVPVTRTSAVAPFPMTAPAAAAPAPVAIPPVSLPAQLAPPVAEPPSALPPKLSGMPNLPKIPAMTGRPTPFSRPPGSPVSAEEPAVAPAAGLPSLSLPATEAHEDLGQPFSAASLRAEPPHPALKTPEPFDPSKLFGETPAPKPAAPFTAPPVSTTPRRPAPAPAAKAPAQGMPAIEFNFGESGDPVRTTLRALFMTDEDLSTEEIVNRCGELSGLQACLIISSGGVVSSGKDSSCEEVANFTANAPRSYEYLTGLAQSMGIEGQGSFTLRTGATVRTFFIERGLCLAVLHGQAGFEPGVRDKLILTARSLADLIE